MSGYFLSGYFRRQLADYVEFHRDPRNFAMHVIGILFLFTGAVLPLSLIEFHIFDTPITLAAILAIPALIYWILLDTALGTAILAMAAVLLAVATMIANQASSAMMWSIFSALVVLGLSAQIVGHKVFEGREASLFTFPSHLMLGPMFVMAKLFIALGFRRDLAAIIGPPQQT